jgi:hypothetical protein
MAFDNFEGADRDKRRMEIGSEPLRNRNFSSHLSNTDVRPPSTTGLTKNTPIENVRLFDEIQVKSRQLAEVSERKSPTPELRIPNAAAQTRGVSAEFGRMVLRFELPSTNNPAPGLWLSR